jgi:hypothetical protein
VFFGFCALTNAARPLRRKEAPSQRLERLSVGLVS